MKAFKAILWALLVAVSTANHAANNPSKDTVAQDRKEFVKNYNKTFSINAKHLVILANKYGKIDVKTGSSSQCIVNVTIKANTNTQGEADKVFDRINIAFSEGPDFVKTETTIESNSGSWFTWGNNGTEYTIDYDVTMPVENNLDISNKYGNCYIAALNNWVKIDQKYGDFKLEKAGSSTVQLAYGRGSIGSINGLTAQVSYGKLSSPSVKDLSLTSKYSEFKFDNLGNVAINSAYDDYEITNVTNLTVTSKYGDFEVGNVVNTAIKSGYTDFKIKQLDNSAEFTTSYGDVRIQAVKTNFGVINIDSKYTDFVIGVGSSPNFQLDVKTSYGDVNRPASFKHKIDNEKGSSRELVGSVGDSNAKSTIKARMSYGDLVLR